MSASRLSPLAALALAAAALAGCNTYLEAKSDITSGRMQQRVADAEARVLQAQQENQDLQDQQLALERDIERNERRIAAAQDELASVDIALKQARSKQRLSQAQYEKLKREADALNGELAVLDLEMQGGGSSAEIAAREARLRDLERRKVELEDAIAAALGR